MSARSSICALSGVPIPCPVLPLVRSKTGSEDDVAARSLYESLGFINREGGPDGPITYFYERGL